MWSRFVSWLDGVTRRRRAEQDMRDEMAFHLEARAGDRRQQGLSPAQAARRARLEFGSVDRYTEENREARGLRAADELAGDLRYAWRMLKASPLSTTVAVGILVVAIGANTAVFSVLEAVLLRSLPVVRPGELRQLAWTEPANRGWRMRYDGLTRPGQAGGGRLMTSFSWPIYVAMRDRTTAFASLFLFAGRDVSLDAGGRAQQAQAVAVSGTFVDGLGVIPAIGRGIGPADDRVDAPPVVMLGHRAWLRSFGGDPAVVGRAVRVNGLSAVVVGVTPAAFEGLEPGRPFDLLLPIASFAAVLEGSSTLADDHRWAFGVMGRLAPGVDDARAAAETDALFRAALPPDFTSAASGPPRLFLESGGQGLDRLRRTYAKPLYLLTAVMVAVLGIACANVAGLLLMRTASRQRELAMRLALGASRLRLARQLLTESVVLAVLGAAAGGVLAYMVRGALLPALNQGDAPIELTLGASPWVFGFSIGLCLLVGLACGLLPALRATPAGAAAAFGRTLSRGATGAPRLYAGRLLITVQVALSLVLVVGAALFTRTLLNLRAQPLGFREERLLLFRMDATSAGYADRRLLDFYTTVLERVRALPGVEAAAFSRWGLLEGGATRDGVLVPGAPPGRDDVGVHLHFVSPGFFETMGIGLIGGRDVSPRDGEDGPAVMVVNQAAARRIAAAAGWTSILGRSVLYGGPDARTEIVGVVADARFASLREPAPPTVYLPYRQHRQHRMSFAVRAAGDPSSLTEAVRRAVAEVDADVPLFGVRTQIEQLDVAVRQERVFALLASGFGGLALVLACLGIYGTLGYAVARRWPEIGLRVALGATRGNIVALIVRESIAPVAAGAAIGVGLALVTTRFVQSQLFAIAPRDPVTLAAATVALVGAALVASWLPSRRAARIDPVTALRAE